MFPICWFTTLAPLVYHLYSCVGVVENETVAIEKLGGSNTLSKVCRVFCTDSFIFSVLIGSL